MPINRRARRARGSRTRSRRARTGRGGGSTAATGGSVVRASRRRSPRSTGRISVDREAKVTGKVRSGARPTRRRAPSPREPPPNERTVHRPTARNDRTVRRPTARNERTVRRPTARIVRRTNQRTRGRADARGRHAGYAAVTTPIPATRGKHARETDTPRPVQQDLPSSVTGSRASPCAPPTRQAGRSVARSSAP